MPPSPPPSLCLSRSYGSRALQKNARTHKENKSARAKEREAKRLEKWRELATNARAWVAHKKSLKATAASKVAAAATSADNDDDDTRRVTAAASAPAPTPAPAPPNE